MLRCISKRVLSVHKSTKHTFYENGSGKRVVSVETWELLSHCYHGRWRQDEDRPGLKRGLHSYASPLMPNSSLAATCNKNPPANSSILLRGQRRHFVTEMLPEAMQSFSIWGVSGWLLRTIHMDGAIPYWACFSIINVLVRVTLFPFVLYSAHTAARFGKVAAEIQFFVSIFQNDFKQSKARGASTRELMALLRMGMESLRGVYKLHNINPLAALFSPLLQIPFFIYMSVDLRKIVNGRDPELAQELTDCPSKILSWVPDLTEPDPFYILPMIAGIAMYANIETAIGKKTLAGDAAAKADMSYMLKDLFQSVAIFMPCFASHNPAGMQVYLCTSFVFTTIQGYILRNEQFRSMVGLPSRNREPEAPKYGMTFIEMKELERKAEEMRGDGPVLGEFIMAQGWRLGMPGTKRESTIEWTGHRPTTSSAEDDHVFDIIQFFRLKKPDAQVSLDPNVAFIPGISAPYDEMVERMEQARLEKEQEEERMKMLEGKKVSSFEERDATDEIMEKANRGERPVPTVYATKDDAPRESRKLNPKRFAKLAKKHKTGKKSKRR